MPWYMACSPTQDYTHTEPLTCIVFLIYMEELTSCTRDKLTCTHAAALVCVQYIIVQMLITITNPHVPVSSLL